MTQLQQDQAAEAELARNEQIAIRWIERHPLAAKRLADSSIQRRLDELLKRKEQNNGR